MKLKPSVFFLILISFFLAQVMSADAQNRMLDSLGREYKSTDLHDSTKANILIRAGQLLGRVTKFDSAAYNFQEAVRIVPDEKPKIRAKAYMNLAIVFFYSGRYDQSQNRAEQALLLFEKNDADEEIPPILNVLGSVMLAKGNGKKSSEYLLQAIELAKQNGDSATIMNAGGNLGTTLKESGDWDRMLKYAQLTLSIALQKKAFNPIIQSYLNIAQYYQVNNNQDSAIYYFKKAEKLSREKNNEFVLAKILNNLGNNYLERNDFIKAAELFAEAEPLMEKFSKSDWAILAQNLSVCYTENGEYAKALALLHEVSAIDNQYLTLSIREGVARAFFNVHRTMKRYDSAVFYLERSVMLKDSLQENNNMKTVAELERKYESEQKEERIKFLEETESLKNARIEKQKQLIYTAAAALILIFASLAFSVRAGIQRKRANKALQEKNEEVMAKSESLQLANAEINQQKEEIQAQADNLREVNETVTDKNRKITDSIRYAETIQAAVLPNKERIREAFADYFLIYEPQQIVSGDFYWLETRGSYTFLAVADCTGHGVPGAFMSMLGSSFLTEIIDRENVREPQQILDRLDLKVRDHLNQEDGQNNDGMDIALCRIEHKAEEGFEVLFTGAKRPLLFTDKGELQRLRGTRRGIGGTHISDKAWEQHRLRLKPGSLLFLYSDGFTDQLSPERKRFMTGNFRKLLSENLNRPLPEIRKELSSALSAHRLENPPTDDICVLGVELS